MVYSCSQCSYLCYISHWLVQWWIQSVVFTEGAAAAWGCQCLAAALQQNGLTQDATGEFCMVLLGLLGIYNVHVMSVRHWQVKYQVEDLMVDSCQAVKHSNNYFRNVPPPHVMLWSWSVLHQGGYCRLDVVYKLMEAELQKPPQPILYIVWVEVG